VDPGSHLIEVTSPGKRTWSQRVKLEPGPVTIKIRIPILEEAVAQPKPRPAPPAANAVTKAQLLKSVSGSNWQFAGTVSLGLAGAGALVGS